MTQVVDAPVELQPIEIPDEFSVEVTDEDILLGARGIGDQCAIARAVRRKFLREVEISFSQMFVEGHWMSEWEHNAFDWIADFDRGVTVEPRVVHFKRTA